MSRFGARPERHRPWWSLVVCVVVAVGMLTAQTPQHDDSDHAPFLDDYVGQFELTPSFVLTVTRVGDALYVQGPGQSAAQMRPRSQAEFIIVGSRLRIIFGINPISDEVDHLIFEQDGVGRRAERVATVDIAAETRTVVDVAPTILERYVGTYEEQPGFAITITSDGGQLSAGMEGQRREVVFPVSETEFFYEHSNASLSFEINADGDADRLILHRGGSTVPMDRVKE